MKINVKSVATSAAAVATIGAASVALTSLTPTASADPLPSPDQLSALCNQVTDPGVGYEQKVGFVQNGITAQEGHAADHDLRKAFHDGKFPETFTVTNIAPAGANAAQADVAIGGPKFAGPIIKHLEFIDQGGNWVLEHNSAQGLIQAATS